MFPAIVGVALTLGAWYEVPKDVIVLNWDCERFEDQSPRFVAANGFTQLLVGRGRDMRDWLLKNRDVPNILPPNGCSGGAKGPGPRQLDHRALPC
jgi:hypothetical protein